MNLKPRRHEEPEINMVSLIDVVLMLVIFFMLSSNFTGEGRLRIRLPQATRCRSAAATDALVVTVTAGGAYLVNNRELVNSSPDTLRGAILKSSAGAARPRRSACAPTGAPPISRWSRRWTCSVSWDSRR